MRAARVQSAPEMARREKQIVVRIEDELSKRIDAYVARKREESGLEIPQSVAIRRLLVAGLDSEEKAAAKARR